MIALISFLRKLQKLVVGNNSESGKVSRRRLNRVTENVPRKLKDKKTVIVNRRLISYDKSLLVVVSEFDKAVSAASSISSMTAIVKQNTFLKRPYERKSGIAVSGTLLPLSSGMIAMRDFCNSTISTLPKE